MIVVVVGGLRCCRLGSEYKFLEVLLMDKILHDPY